MRIHLNLAALFSLRVINYFVNVIIINICHWNFDSVTYNIEFKLERYLLYLFSITITHFIAPESRVARRPIRLV